MKYHLQNVATGREFPDTGWLLDDPQGGEPSLVRAIYENKQLAVRGTEHGVYRFADWLPVSRELAGSSAPVTYKSEGLAKRLGLDDLWITFSGWWPEHDARMSTCSFKETEAYSVCGRLTPDEERVLVVASAGNTARAFARVCSENNIPLLLCVPEDNLNALWFNAPINDCVRLVAAASGGDYFDAIHIGNQVVTDPFFFAEGGAKNVARRDGMGTTALSAITTIGHIPDYYFQAVGTADVTNSQNTSTPAGTTDVNVQSDADGTSSLNSSTAIAAGPLSGTISIASYLDSGFLNYAAEAFMAINEGVSINIVDYETETRDLDRYSQIINTALMSGGGEDIIDIHPITWTKLADKGKLVDLNGYMSFSPEEYYQTILDAFIYKNGRYTLPLGFTLDSVYRYSDAYADKEEPKDITYDAVITLADKYPDEILISNMLGMNRTIFATQIFYSDFRDFIDIEAKKADIDNERFINILKTVEPLAQELPDDEPSEDSILQQNGIYHPSMCFNGVENYTDMFLFKSINQIIEFFFFVFAIPMVVSIDMHFIHIIPCGLRSLRYTLYCFFY